MSTKSKKKAATGIRYSDEQKKAVVDFVVDYNSSKGRGGQSAAAKKFKVTPLTIAAWIKASGKKAKPKAKAPKAAKVAKAPKAAKASKSRAASKRGVRYSTEQKQEVVGFVKNYNAANGRGGQSHAAKKFGLSVLTVSAWLKAAGVKGGKAAKASKVKAVKAVKAAGAAQAPAGLAAKVAALVAINKQVSAAEKELEKLYAKQDSVMASFK